MDPNGWPIPSPGAGQPPEAGGPPSPPAAPPPGGLPFEHVDFSEAFSPGRAIGNGWTAFKIAWLPLGVGAILLMITEANCNTSGGNFGGNQQQRTDDPYSRIDEATGLDPDTDPSEAAWRQPPPELDDFLQPELIAAMLAGLLCFGVIKLLLWLGNCFLTTGWYRLHHHVMQTAEPYAFRPLFSGGDRFLHMILHRLLLGVIEVAALVPFLAGIAFAIVPLMMGRHDVLFYAAVGGVLAILGLILYAYVALGITLGPRALVLDDLGPVDALRRSWTVMAGNRLAMFWFYLVLALFAFLAAVAGILMLCIGLLVTLPIAVSVNEFATTEAYLLFTRGRLITGYWRTWAH